MNPTIVAAEATTTSENFETAVPAVPAAEVTRALLDPEVVHAAVAPAVARFLHDGCPGVQGNGDEYDYLGACRDATHEVADEAARAAGLEVDDPVIRDMIWDAAFAVEDLASEGSGIDFDCREAAGARRTLTALANSEPTSPRILRAPRNLFAVTPNIVDASNVWRPTGHAPRLRTNHRTGGSRRSAASRGDPDLGDEPPSHSPSLIGGGR